MAAVQNARDLILQATSPRILAYALPGNVRITIDRLVSDPTASLDASGDGMVTVTVGAEWAPGSDFTGMRFRSEDPLQFAATFSNVAGGWAAAFASSNTDGFAGALFGYGGWDETTGDHLTEFALATGVSAGVFSNRTLGGAPLSTVVLGLVDHAVSITEGTLQYQGVVIDPPPNVGNAFLRDDGQWVVLATSTGTGVATFNTTNKPGASNTNSWVILPIGGVNMTFPAWVV